MNQQFNLVPLRDRDASDERPFQRHGQGELLADAIDLAATGMTCEQIIATLEHRYPGLPKQAYYENPAAEAVMRRMRAAQQRREGREADKRRLRSKGLPERLAIGGEEADEVPDIDEPTEEELSRVTRGSELLALCARYDIFFRLDDEGTSLHTSRPILAGGVLFAAVKRFKTGLVTGLKERLGDGH